MAIPTGTEAVRSFFAVSCRSVGMMMAVVPSSLSSNILIMLSSRLINSTTPRGTGIISKSVSSATWLGYASLCTLHKSTSVSTTPLAISIGTAGFGAT